MSNIISFEDKKEDKELIELLEQFEKHMPCLLYTSRCV